MIIRVKHDADNPYYMMNRASSNDTRLSFRAFGVHAYLMSKPDDWKVNEKELINSHTEGRDSVRAAIKELQANGYLVKVPVRCGGGIIKKWETHVFEVPQERENEVNNPDDQITGNTESSESSSQITEKPDSGNLVDILSKDYTDQCSSLGESQKRNRKTDSEFGKLCLLYESEIGMLTPRMGKVLSDALDKYPFQWCVDAINISVERNKRQWGYANGILRNWERDGKDNQRRQTNGYSNGSGNEQSAERFLTNHQPVITPEQARAFQQTDDSHIPF